MIFQFCYLFVLYLQGYRSSRVTLPVNFACKPGLSSNPLARVTLAVGLTIPPQLLTGPETYISF